MSLFQCDKCGVMENTALSNASHSVMQYLFGRETAMHAEWREVLGLPPDAPLGNYCSACTPIWYTSKGDFGHGPNPSPSPGEGAWHGKFPQTFYPLGTMETGPDGNLREKRP